MAIILYKKIKKKVIRVEMRSRSVRCEERGQMEGTYVLRRPCGRKKGYMRVETFMSYVESLLWGSKSL